MIYAEVYVNPEPWSPRPVFVGVIAENPKNGHIEARLAGKGVIRAIADADHENESNQVWTTAKAFFESVRKLAEFTNQKQNPAKIAELFRQIPDRGTSIQFSTSRSGEFSSVKKALDFCIASREVGGQSLQVAASSY